MKKCISLLVTLAFMGSLGAMNKDISEASYETPLTMPDIRLPIVECLFILIPTKKAIESFKAWSLVNKESVEFFKESEKFTAALVRSLYNLSYYYDFDICLLDNMSCLLNKDIFTDFKRDLSTNKNLVLLFKTCSKSKKWDRAIEEVSTAKKNAVINPDMHYWKDTYKDFPAKKTLLIHALELDAPENVIKCLLNYKLLLKKLHPTTPAPFLAQFAKCIEQDKNLSSIRARRIINPTQEQKACLALTNAEEIMSLLLKGGASVNGSFTFDTPIGIYCVTPLLLAAEESNIQRLRYLVSNGALLNAEAFRALMMLEAPQREFSSLMEIILPKAENKSLLIKLIEEITCFEYKCLQDEEFQNSLQGNDIDWKERSRSMLALLLEKEDIDLNTPLDCSTSTNKMTLLSLADEYNNEEVAQILLSKGALDSREKNEKTDKAQLFTQKIMQHGYLLV
ncbi:hypothetical protein H0W26_05245, partial [Candidatus Dependentiae bacterium]|nr:hypothetical protein [Candidatus Dependentiae bacterium]